MKISIIGCGYVGIVTGVCLANSGHKIYFYDKDKKKLSDFKSGNNLIFEKNLDNRLNIARKKNNIFFCNTLEESIKESDATFICVGTPLKKKNIDLQYIKKITIQLSKLLQKKNIFL